MIKTWVIGLILLLLPAIVVQWAKIATAWGPILATPHTRQKGPAKARVVVVEYSDFQCPSCAHMQTSVKNLMAAYPDNVRLAFKYYPLTRIHKHALLAATAAECAGEQNQFWPYHDKLFENQLKWASLPDATTTFTSYAAAAALDTAAFSACLADPASQKSVQADMAEGNRRQIQSTPTFFIGETRLVGNYFASDGARVIERELRK